MDLAPVAEATHVAVKSGAWFDPDVWANGEVPGEGAKVVIPDGVSLCYGEESDVSLFTVRVDGALHFATDRDTFMEVDTLLVTPSGALSIGTADAPVEVGVEAVISIADNGPIDVAWDPQLLSRGVITHGRVEIHGAEKENFLQVSVDPMAGDTSITFAENPEGWEVGDKIVLAGTKFVGSDIVAQGAKVSAPTEDEELVITAIDGSTVYFDTPLAFDHDGPRADLKAYVANYSRNVRFETENADALPAHQRGHVMFMHNDDIDVRYAEFHELGRTDKSERAFDLDDLSGVEADTNVKGRYAVHIHRAGVGDQGDPAMLVGNAVWGSPGWGFVHHDSHAILDGNAAYDVFGAAFVSETGNETGRWVDNISIKTLGANVQSKNADDVAAFDLGRNGVGFWFQGRLVQAVDNVAATTPEGVGFAYFHRGLIGDFIPVDPDTVDQPGKLRYQDEIYIDKPNIELFKGNVAVGAERGLEVIKHGPRQGHDVRSMIEDFTAWESQTGVHLEYTGHYTLTNLDLVGPSDEALRPHYSAGVRISRNAFDIVVDGVRDQRLPQRPLHRPRGGRRSGVRQRARSMGIRLHRRQHQRCSARSVQPVLKRSLFVICGFARRTPQLCFRL